MFGSNCCLTLRNHIFSPFLSPLYDYRNDKFVTLCVASSMKHSSQWDAVSRSAVPERPQAHGRRCWRAPNPQHIRKVSGCVHKNPPSSLILSRMSLEVQSSFISRFHLSGYWPYGGGRSCLRKVATNISTSHPPILSYLRTVNHT